MQLMTSTYRTGPCQVWGFPTEQDRPHASGVSSQARANSSRCRAGSKCPSL